MGPESTWGHGVNDVNRRAILGLALLAACLAGCSDGGPVARIFGAGGPIRVGLLHSKTGPFAISEASLIDAEVMAIEEINRSGGLLGKNVEAVVADGRSDPSVFAREAERLIADEKVAVLIGCYASSCRRSLLPVLSREKHLLIYPAAYEGMESSANVIYVGAAPNQQIIPTVSWCAGTLKARRFALIGSESDWARAVNTIVKDQLAATGAEIACEIYVGERPSAESLAGAVKRLVESRPDVILNTVEGDANLAFYRAIRAAGVARVETPVLNFTMAEDEARRFPRGALAGDYAVGNYFQTIDRPENTEFVRKFKARFGESRVTSDAIVTAYNGVMFWAQAVRDADSAEPHAVRAALARASLDAPEGVISIDRENFHTWRPFFVGKFREDGLIDIVSTVSKPIQPSPFPFSRSREQWESYRASLDLRRAGPGGAGPPAPAVGP